MKYAGYDDPTGRPVPSPIQPIGPYVLDDDFARAGLATATEVAARQLGFQADVREYGVVGDGVTDDTTALQAAADTGRPLYIADGLDVLVSAAVTVGSGFTIRGATKRTSTIVSTHGGAIFTSATPGTRTYDWYIEDLTLQGPGKAVAGSCAVDFVSVSSSHMARCVVRGFERGVRVRSATSGWAVYNRFLDVTATLCGRGFSIEALGSNATRWLVCRANSCDTGVHIEDSNQCVFESGEVESCALGIYVHATSAALADFNGITDTRFEGNTTAWQATSLVRLLHVIAPRPFGTYTVSDAGDRTQHHSYATGMVTKSAAQLADGAFQFVRTANGGAELPAFVVRDGVTTAGTPVTVQAETERAVGFPFRAVRGGLTYWDVDAAGTMRFPQGGLVEMKERPGDATAPAADHGRLYLKDNGAGKTQLCVRFATGAVQVLATEP
jgi:hypothetical protein